MPDGPAVPVLAVALTIGCEHCGSLRVGLAFDTPHGRVMLVQCVECDGPEPATVP